MNIFKKVSKWLEVVSDTNEIIMMMVSVLLKSSAQLQLLGVL